MSSLQPPLFHMLQTSTKVDNQWSERSKKELVVLGEVSRQSCRAPRIDLSCPSSLLWAKDGYWAWKCGLERQNRYTEYWSRAREEPYQPCHIWIWLDQSLGWGHCSPFLPLCRKWGRHGREASPGTGGWGLISLRLFQADVWR